MMKKIIFVFNILTTIIFTYNLFAVDNVKITVKTDTNLVKVGERIGLTFEALTNENFNVFFPEIKDSIGKLEIISKSKIDTLIIKDTILLKQTFEITSFEEGSYSIPSFIFSYENKQDKILKTISSESIFLSFITIEVDTSQGIKDIKAPFEFPYTIEEFLPLVLAIISFVILIYLIFFFIKKYKNKPKKEILKYDITIPADIEALEALKLLENERLWQKGFYKEYYIRLTDILRTYIHRRYSINSFEMTSFEILDSLKDKDISKVAIQILEEIFKISDLAKFAKYQPIAEENTKCMSLSIDFIEQTKDISQIISKNDNEVSK